MWLNRTNDSLYVAVSHTRRWIAFHSRFHSNKHNTTQWYKRLCNHSILFSLHQVPQHVRNLVLGLSFRVNFKVDHIVESRTRHDTRNRWLRVVPLDHCEFMIEDKELPIPSSPQPVSTSPSPSFYLPPPASGRTASPVSSAPPPNEQCPFPFSLVSEFKLEQT